MAAQIRVLRRRIRATQSMRKITKAQELIATSRIAKAQARVQAARPYTQGITAMVSAFLHGTEFATEDAENLADELSVDEVHIVYTEFRSMLGQVAVAHRLAPIEVEYGSADTVESPSYEFEPDADALFGSLLPRYLSARVYAALLESAASESASRRRAMKAATDNANDLIKALTLEANRARQ